MKQVQTERGLICVEKVFSSNEDACKNGYFFCFSSRIGEVYSKCLDDKGLYHSFAIVREGAENDDDI